MNDYERATMCCLFEFNFDYWLEHYENFDVFVRDWHTVDMRVQPRLEFIQITITTK